MSDESSELSDLWRCPKCRSCLVRDNDRLVCTDGDCRLSFSIRDGLPVMLVESAVELDQDPWSRIVTR